MERYSGSPHRKSPSRSSPRDRPTKSKSPKRTSSPRRSGSPSRSKKTMSPRRTRSPKRTGSPRRHGSPKRTGSPRYRSTTSPRRFFYEDHMGGAMTSYEKTPLDNLNDIRRSLQNKSAAYQARRNYEADLKKQEKYRKQVRKNR